MRPNQTKPNYLFCLISNFCFVFIVVVIVVVVPIWRHFAFCHGSKRLELMEFILYILSPILTFLFLIFKTLKSN